LSGLRETTRTPNELRRFALPHFGHRRREGIAAITLAFS
jgi:hypothetical protein